MENMINDPLAIAWELYVSFPDSLLVNGWEDTFLSFIVKYRDVTGWSYFETIRKAGRS